MVMILRPIRFTTIQDNDILKMLDKKEYGNYNEAVRHLVDIGLQSKKKQKDKNKETLIEEYNEVIKKVEDLQKQLDDVHKKEIVEKENEVKKHEEQAIKEKEKEEYNKKQDSWKEFYNKNYNEMSKIYHKDYIQKAMPKDPLEKILFFEKILKGEIKIEELN